MKRVLCLVAFSFALIFTIGVPTQTSAATQVESETEVKPNLITHSMQITHTLYYSINQQVPVYYYYNNLGWSGTLRMKSMSTDGKVNKVIYKGTVYCSGTCPGSST